MTMSDNNNTTNKPKIVLLGDGFFARGFLHHINYNKFFITQIYKDSFINPQDIMYSLQRGEKYQTGMQLHLRDYITKSPDVKMNMEITKLELYTKNNNVIINGREIEYNHLVIGLGAQKSLATWVNELNKSVEYKNLSVGIIGLGPTGIELASILSKTNIVDMFDMLPRNGVLNFIKPENKNMILDKLREKNITMKFGGPYNRDEHYHSKIIFCGGSKPNQLINYKKGIDGTINNMLLMKGTDNIYIGGDCANTEYIKTAQVAYQQGVYVAKRLNGEIEDTKPFEYKHNGIAMNMGDKKVLIEGHNIIPDGVYSDIIIKLYSWFCI
jgi:NADH dehydrogenase FAD-containing subunit